MNEMAARAGGTGLYLLSRVARATCRRQIEGIDRFHQAFSGSSPVVLTTWHGQSLLILTGLLSEVDAHRLMLPFPDDIRGVVLSTFVKKMGMIPFPMNLKGEQSFSAARQLSRLIKLMKQGHSCYINPDGSDGPAYVPKPGVAFIASKTQGLILPLGAYARHRYALNRWDTYAVPLPFGRISICVGEPLEVSRMADISAVLDDLTNRLHRVTAQAKANYYERAGTRIELGKP